MILARQGGFRALVLNHSARFVWERLAGGTDAAALPAHLAAEYGIDDARASADVAALLGQWREAGLLAPAVMRRHYAMAGIGFTVAFGDAALDAAFAPVFAHLEIAAHPAEPDHPIAAFAVAWEDGAVVLRGDGAELCRDATPDLAIQRLMTDATLHAYACARWALSVHAAALGDASGCLLLPGVSGTGKTTLAAALLARPGMQYLTDDIALLRPTDLHVLPMPGALVLKEGSWPLLPDCAGAPEYRRFGMAVRYLAPPAERIATTPLPVRAIVVPRRRAGARAALSPLPAIDAFGSLIAAPATLAAPVTQAALARLTGWVEERATLQLDYDDPHEAAALLQDWLRGG